MLMPVRSSGQLDSIADEVTIELNEQPDQSQVMGRDETV